MKKIIVFFLACLLMLSLAACGDKAQPRNAQIAQTVPLTEKPATPDDILEEIKQDFAETLAEFSSSYDDTVTAIGDTYEDYVANEQLLNDWYQHILDDSEALLSRMIDGVKDYCRAIGPQAEAGTLDADEAIDRVYDEVYNGVLDDYYDEVYTGLIDNAYERYYNGIIDDGYDTVDWDEWYDVSDRSHSAWYDASSGVYDLWYDASSEVYDIWWDVSSAFWSEDYDIEKILTKEDTAETEDAETEAETAYYLEVSNHVNQMLLDAAG